MLGSHSSSSTESSEHYLVATVNLNHTLSTNHYAVFSYY